MLANCRFIFCLFIPEKSRRERFIQKKTLQHIQIAIWVITSAQTDLEFLLFCLQKGENLRIRKNKNDLLFVLH